MLKDFFSKKTTKIIIPTIAVILAAAIILPSVFFRGNQAEPENIPTNANISQVDNQVDNIVTRAQWIEKLTDTMGYDKSNDAESYFTDVSSSNSNYDNIQIAVAYNLIATDSDRFNPNDKATREFVASTTAKAVGFIGTPMAILNDISSLQNTDNIRLAVDNGIFICPNGNFNPFDGITILECNDIIKKVKAITTISVDPNHTDTVTFNEGVIDLSESPNPITYNDSTAMSVAISGVDASALAVGTVYLLPPSNEYPYGVARKVKSITQNGNDYVVENEEPKIEEVLAKIDIQGEYYPDYSRVVWADGITGEFVPDNGITPTALFSDYNIQPLSYQPQPTAIQPMADFEGSQSGSLDFAIAIETDDGEISGSCKLRFKAAFEMDANLLAAKINKASLLIEESYVLSTDFQCNVVDKSYPICQVPIPIGATGLSIQIEISLSASGEFVMTYSDEIQSEFGFNVIDNRPSVHNRLIDHTRKIEVAAKATIGFEIKPTLNAWGIDVADVAATIGAGVNAKPILPQNCIGIDIYMSLSIEASLFPDILAVSIEQDIFTEENSPVKSNLHYEKGIFVDACTKTNAENKSAYIYFPTEKGIVRMDPGDYSKWQVICSDRAGKLSVAQDWIFYSNIDENGALYKITTEGKERQRVGSYDWVSGIFSDTEADTIYFSCTDAYQTESFLIKIKTDGTGSETLNPNDLFVQKLLGIQGDYLYYTAFIPNPHNFRQQLYRIKKDGTGQETIVDNDDWDFTDGIVTISGEWVYFDGFEPQSANMPIGAKSISKMQISSTEFSTMYSMYPLCSVYGPNCMSAYEEWIYFGVSNFPSSSEFDGLYKVKNDGSDAQKISADTAFFMSSFDNSIYYISIDDSLLYKMNLDGSGKQIVCQNEPINSRYFVIG